MKRILWFLIIALLVLSGCSNIDVQIEEMTEEITALNQDLTALSDKIELLNEENAILETGIQELQVSMQYNASALSTAIDVLQMIADEDWQALSADIDPTVGVRMSPYPYVDVTNDLVLTPTEIAGYASDTQVYTWGLFDGSGESIDLNKADYYDRFIYDADFIQASLIGNNTVVAQGNLINNIATIYPTAVFVEFHIPQIDPQYMGMDWRSPTLVLEENNGNLYVVGIVHGEWTT